MVFFLPNYLGHPDNYIEASSVVTPEHIVPEWYFLPFYAILRSIPSKLFGVLAMVSSIVALVVFPSLVGHTIRSGYFRSVFQCLFWFFVLNFVLLGWLGACPVEAPFVMLSQLSTSIFFLMLLFVIPVCGRVDIEVLRVC